jgi:hypothetical protein
VLREARTDEWIDRAAALRLLQRFRAGEAGVSWRQVWVLIVFSLWHQIYLERVYDPAALGWERPPRPRSSPDRRKEVLSDLLRTEQPGPAPDQVPDRLYSGKQSSSRPAGVP